MGEQDPPTAPLEELVRLFRAQRDAPAALEAEAFARRHPQYENELRDVLLGMEMIERAALALDARDALDRFDTIALLRGARVRDPAHRPVADGCDAAEPPGDPVPTILAEIESTAGPLQRYRIEGELARGGQGAVLGVWDRNLRRRLAMKVSLQARDSGEGTPLSARRSLGRFLEEAHVTAQLDHPGIVPVHELGLDAERRVFFTMKLVRGRSLAEILAAARAGAAEWSTARVLEILLKVCDAMAYAHARGVIHRDLKPANVMVGRYGEVHVMDWGLARMRGREDARDVRIRPPTEGRSSSAGEERPDDSPLMTMDGDVVGTPAYMPPEQALGRIERMGPPSDVHAVGAMLYELLTGAMPHVSPGERVNNRAVWARVVEGSPAAVQDLAPGAPPELAAICEKAMARQPEDRYADMSALADDLRAYLEHRVVAAYETGALADLRKWVGRNRALAASIAAALLLALSGLGGTALVQARERRATDEQREVAEAVVGFLSEDLLGAVFRERGSGAHDLTLLEVLEGAEDRIDEACAPGGLFADRLLIEAAVRQSLGVSLLASSRVEAALGQFQQAWKLREEHRGPEHRDTVETRFYLGQVHNIIGPTSLTESHMNAVLAWCEDFRPGSDERIDGLRYNALGILGNVFAERGFQDQSERARELAFAGALATLGPASSLTLGCRSTLASSALARGDFDGAERLWRENLAAMKVHLKPSDLLVVRDQCHLARTLWEHRGAPEEGRTLLEEALSTCREHWGGLAGWVPAMPVDGMSAFLVERGRTDEALLLLEEWLGDNEELLSQETLGATAQQTSALRRAAGLMARAGRLEESGLIERRLEQWTGDRPDSSRAPREGAVPGTR